MIRLGLIRHGHTHWNRAGRIQGRTDIPLDSAAKDELSQQRLPAKWQGAALVSSPLVRASETACLIADQDPISHPALMEMDWGDWEGLKGLDLKSDPQSGFRDIEDWGWDYRPQNGETPRQVWNRLKPWVTGLQEDTLAVCHIGIMRVLLARACDWNFQGPPPFRIKRNRIYPLQFDNGILTLQGDPDRLIRR